MRLKSAVGDVCLSSFFLPTASLAAARHASNRACNLRLNAVARWCNAATCNGVAPSVVGVPGRHGRRQGKGPNNVGGRFAVLPVTASITRTSAGCNATLFSPSSQARLRTVHTKVVAPK